MAAAWLVAAAAVGAAGGGAWACVPQARLVSLAPRSSGPAGSEVTVKGLAFDVGAAEVRWNASDGARLASAIGPDFSVPVVIPPAEEGMYSIVVISRALDGSVGSAGSAAFQVTGAGGTQSTASPVAGGPPAHRGSPSRGSSLLLGAGLAVAAGALAVGGGLVGASLSRRRRRPAA